MDSFNIVLLGENFPVSSIDLNDFDLLGRPVRELVRLPVVLEAQAGEFRINVLPDRFEIGAKEVNPTGDKQKATSDGAKTFLEYAGRRTITAVGHNLTTEVPIGGNESALLGSFVGYDTLAAFLGTDDSPEADLTVNFKTGTDSSGKLTIRTRGRDQSILLDFNFHYGFGKSGLTISVEDAIDQLPQSLEKARTLADAFPFAVGLMESA